jgi:predicted DNA-binding transcriptional regulator AlpA
MALGNNSNAIYLTISDGKIVRQFKEPTALSVQRTNKTGKIVHEEFNDYIEGFITSIDTQENDYGKFWVVGIEDKGERYQLKFNYSGGTASTFLKILPNVDFTQPVKINPSMKVEDGKKKTSLFISQGGQTLKWFWNKENPGQLPQLEQKKVKGKVVWDDSDMMDYLEAYTRQNIIPKLTGKFVAVDNDAEEEPPF